MLDLEIVSAGPSGSSGQEARWYAIYTCPRHEKCVAQQLADRSVEFFLPLYRSVRRWNDRSRLIELPLLPGYLFIHIALQDRLLALQIPGVVRLLSFRGLPLALPDAEVQQIRDAIHGNLGMEPHSYLRVGSPVRVIHGPLAGTEGLVVRSKNTFRVVICLQLLLRSIAVELDAADIEPIPGRFSSQPNAGILAMPTARC